VEIQLTQYGNYCQANYPASYKWLNRLCERTANATALNLLAFMSSTGLGDAVEPNQAQAFLYHSFAALNGNIRSELTLAYRHLFGISLPRSCPDSVKHYKSVADKCPPALPCRTNNSITVLFEWSPRRTRHP
jgi:SEL1 protein